MELQQDKGLGPFIEAYHRDSFKVDRQSYDSSILVHAEKKVECWRPTDLMQLTVADLQLLITLKPAIVLLGTGKNLIFPAADLFTPLQQAQISVEIMDTAAACRTYNVLMSESRNVLAALLLR